jgi:U4/U6.U5 tri-snRNP-associated protein 1
MLPQTKKKKRAATRVKIEDDDEGAAAAAGPSAAAQEDADMADVKQEPAAPRVPRQLTTENFVDDDELAASLAKARRSKAKRTLNKMTPEQIAKNRACQKLLQRCAFCLPSFLSVAAQREAEAADQGDDAAEPAFAGATNGDSKEGLTFDDTSEFVRTIQTRDSSPGTSARRAAAAAASSSRRLAEAERQMREGSGGAIPRIKSEPLETDETHAASNGEQRVRVKQEESEAGDAPHEDGEISDEEMAYLDELPVPKAKDADGVEIGAPEGLVSSGMAATLALLRNSGMIEEVTPEQREREQKQKQYDAWLELRRREDRMRQAERDASKAQGSSKDQATREYENRMREAEDARLALEKFKNYKPDIDIKYHDEVRAVLREKRTSMC